MAKGLLINLDRCSGCDSCIVACKLENGLDLGHFYNKVISIGPVGTFPNVEGGPINATAVGGVVLAGNATLDVPTWVGIGEASAEQAAGTCERTSFGGRRPAIVQRIGEGSDGRPLDRNLTCPDTDLTGLVRPW